MADTEISRTWGNNEIHWKGQSGKAYLYWSHRIGTYLNNEPGNYIYAKEVEPGSWEPLYIGHASSLQDRLLDQEQEARAKAHGATHVHAHTARGGEFRRTAETDDLVARWKPICNDQGTPGQEGPLT